MAQEEKSLAKVSIEQSLAIRAQLRAKHKPASPKPALEYLYANDPGAQEIISHYYFNGVATGHRIGDLTLCAERLRDYDANVKKTHFLEPFKDIPSYNLGLHLRSVIQKYVSLDRKTGKALAESKVARLAGVKAWKEED